MKSSLESIKNYFENVGLLRISCLYSKKNAAQGKRAQKIARIALFIFAGFFIIDQFSPFLPNTSRIFVKIPLVVCALSLSVSLLLNGVIKISDYSSRFFPQKKVQNVGNKNVTHPRAKRSLINEFNASEKYG